MAGEALLIGIATIAVVIAGFTAITSGLAPASGAWDRAQRIRQRAIVSTSFNVTFESLAPLILFAATGDERASMMLASAGVAVYAVGVVVVRGRQMFRAGAFSSGSARLLFVLGPLACLLFAANALLFMSVGVFALALCVQLSVAAVSFYSLISTASS